MFPTMTVHCHRYEVASLGIKLKANNIVELYSHINRKYMVVGIENDVKKNMSLEFKTNPYFRNFLYSNI